MPEPSQELLERLVEAVCSSPKYQNFSRDFVSSVGARELAKGRRIKEAVKATKNKLHQVGGAYQVGAIDYQRWLTELKAARQSMKEESLHLVCRHIMSLHASTSERLDILDKFYPELLQGLGEIHSVLDVACGLNPLSLPWMGLPPDVEYLAVDIDQALIDFINGFFALLAVRGRARACDVLETCPSPGVDLAIILKAIPCLEQLDKSAAQLLFDRLQAKHMLVSFPVHSLGGRMKGMLENYAKRFERLAIARSWSFRRFEFPTELVFVVSSS